MMLLNRDGKGFKLREDGWYPLSPRGEHPGTEEFDDGTEQEVLQIVDDQALAEMVAAFELEKAKPNFAGLLVDFDHFSHDPEKSSRAAGWMMDLQNRGADGLWTKIDLSTSGEAALTGGDFRFISPVWDGPRIGNRGGLPLVRPNVLKRAGLTNDPNLKGSLPLSNRAGGKTGDKPKTTHTMTLQPTTILAMAAALGLSPESTDEQVNAALPAAKDLMNRGRDYATLKPKFDALLDAQAESDLTEHGITDPAVRADLKPGLLANREQGLKFLKHARPAEKGRGALTNRAIAKNPETPTAEEAEAKKAEARGARIANRARALRAATPTLGLQQSYQLAEDEIADEEGAK